MVHVAKLSWRSACVYALQATAAIGLGVSVSGCNADDHIGPRPAARGEASLAVASTGSVLVTNVATRSGKPYQVTKGLVTGVTHYIDRSYTMTAVPPALEGATYIRTANDDKDASPGSADFLRFDVSTDARVYVAHDNRLPRPAWLTAGFQDTGIDLPTSDLATTFSVFQRVVSPGRVTLGSNVAAPAGRSMYLVMIQPIGDAQSTPYSLTGIPVGAFGLPENQYADTATWTASLQHLSPDNTGLAALAKAQSAGVRMVISLAGSRTTFKNADGTFNLEKWKANVARWRTLNLAPYIDAGTIVGHYLIDEPNWTGAWGGQAISRATLEEMARYSKSIWPAMATAVRVHPGYLLGYTWRALDFAWAQWEGPLHTPSNGQTPEQFRDRQIADAKTAGVKLMFGLNFLDGGDGSSGIPGTYSLSVTKTRWQMSAAEVQRVGTVLASATYGCGLISWRWSPTYPAYSSLSAAQLAGIRNFNTRTDVKAALVQVANAARRRPTTSCKR